MFKSEPERSVSLLIAAAWSIAGILAALLGGTWHRTDERLNDWLNRFAVAHGFASTADPRICYVVITDRTYARLNEQALNRAQLAKANDILTELGASSIVYDLILARPGNQASDSLLRESLARSNRVFLPAGYAARPRNHSDVIPAFPKSQGHGGPPVVIHEIAPMPSFVEKAHAGGHVYAPSDTDGVYRRMYLFVQSGPRLVPSLALSVLLDLRGQKMDDLNVTWGERLTLSALGNHPALDIPIDSAGAARIPFSAPWGSDFDSIALDELLQQYDDPDRRGNLLNLIDGRIVLIGDTSTGIADAGATPLENDVPLVAMHASLLSGLLQNRIFSMASTLRSIIVIGLCSCILILTACLARPGSLHAGAVLSFMTLMGFLLFGYYRYTLYPGATMLIAVGSIYAGTTASIQVRAWKQSVIIRAENALLHRDLAIAATIQSHMLPFALPAREELEIAAINIQAQSIGGDFYDVIELPSRQILILAGDVSGKGIPAALNMSGILSSFRTIVSSGAAIEPREILLKLNDVLVKQVRPGEVTGFATAVLLSIDPAEMTVRMARCGHELPIFWNSDKKDMREFKTSGFMLGVSPSAVLSKILAETTIHLSAGESIFLYSDGVTEAADRTGEFYGLSRLKTAIRGLGRGSAQDHLDTILGDIRAFSGEAPQHDDITLVVMRLTGA